MKRAICLALLSMFCISSSLKADILCGVECVNDAQFGYNLDIFICTFAPAENRSACRDRAQRNYEQGIRDCLNNCDNER